MDEQAAAGWYPDGQGSDRYWDGTAWTDQIRALAVSELPKKAGAFSKLGTAVKKAAVEKKVAREELTRKQAEDALEAGSLVTTGVFGTSTVEIYENGYVRVATWGENASGTSARKSTRRRRTRGSARSSSRSRKGSPPDRRHRLKAPLDPQWPSS